MSARDGLLRGFAAVLCAAAVGCNSTPPATPGDLSAPTAMTINGAELYIASTNSDELRVLYLSTNVVDRQFENAPNPIYVLSVPVVTRPVVLGTSTNDPESYWVYAISTVAARMSVVDTSSKIEAAEVALPGTPLSMTVWTHEDGTDVAYVGTRVGTEGYLTKVEVPLRGDIDAGAMSASEVLDLGQATPASIALSPDGSTIAVADSSADESASPARGGLMLVSGFINGETSDAGSLEVQRVLVGGPAQKVVYSPESSDPPTGNLFPAGAFIYVLTGGASCPTQLPCSGVQVVQGTQALQVAPGVMGLPIQVPGTALDVAVGGRGFPDGGAVAYPVIGLPEAVGGSVATGLVLGITSTDGNVYMADGQNMRLFDTSQVLPSASGFLHFDPDGTAYSLLDDGGFATLPDGGPPPYPIFWDGGEDATGPDTSSIQLSKGAVRDETIDIIYNGDIPGLTARSGSVSGAGVLTDLSADFGALGAQVDDLVELDGSTDPSCPATGVITAVGPDAATGLLSGEAQLYIPGLSASCYPPGGFGQYTVSVFGTLPYAVVGTVSGLLGRTDVGQLFQGPADYYYRPPGYNPLAPGMSFFMLPAGDSRPNAGWSFATNSGITPFAARPESGLTVPADIVWAPDLFQFFATYPGGNAVEAVDPAALQGADVSEFQ